MTIAVDWDVKQQNKHNQDNKWERNTKTKDGIEYNAAKAGNQHDGSFQVDIHHAIQS